MAQRLRDAGSFYEAMGAQAQPLAQAQTVSHPLTAQTQPRQCLHAATLHPSPHEHHPGRRAWHLAVLAEINGGQMMKGGGFKVYAIAYLVFLYAPKSSYFQT